jgi:hypothetical protein
MPFADPIRPLWAALAVLLPALSAWRIVAGVRLWEDEICRPLAGITLFVVLHLLSVHLLATLEMARVIASVSLFQIAVVQGVALGLVLLLLPRTAPRLHASARDRAATTMAAIRSLPLPVLIGGGVVAASYAVFLANLLLSYPMGTDAVSYHFPTAVRWLQEGSLRIPTSKEWHFSLSGNAEIPMMVLLGTGWQALATLPQMLGAVVLSLASYRIATRLGASPAAAVAAVLILLNIPMITWQTFSGYIDLYGGSFIVAAVALFLARHDELDRPLAWWLFPGRLAVCGLACGIALGTKPTFYVYSALFWLGAVGVSLVERTRHRIPVKTVASVMLVAILLPGIFWFGRTVSATGNPLYPVKVEVKGYTIFDGYDARTQIGIGDQHWVRSRSEWIIYPWTEWKRFGSSYGTGTGLGAAFATFVPLGVLSALAGMVFWRSGGAGVQPFLPAALLVGGLVWWFAMGRMLRFTIPLIACACALTAPLLDRLLSYRPVAVGGLLVLSLATTSLIAAFEPAHSLLGRARTWNWTRAVFYGVPAIVDEFPRGSCVLNAGDFINNFGLAGKYLSNRILTLYESPERLTEEFIHARGVDYVVKTGTPDENDRVLSAMGAKLVFDDAHVLLGGGTDNPWRIWHVGRPPGSPGSGGPTRRGRFE